MEDGRHTPMPISLMDTVSKLQDVPRYWVEELQRSSGQKASSVTVVVGVALGTLIAVVVVWFVWCIYLCCPGMALCLRSAEGGNRKRAREIDVDAEIDHEEGEDRGGPSGSGIVARNTEGAYRSDSDASDDGEGAKATREAQRRSRKSGGV